MTGVQTCALPICFPVTIDSRDEIWFAEKDSSGASKLFTMNQFSVRYDSKIEKAYLLGRYGAVPIFKMFDEIDS